MKCIKFKFTVKLSCESEQAKQMVGENIRIAFLAQGTEL